MITEKEPIHLSEEQEKEANILRGRALIQSKDFGSAYNILASEKDLEGLYSLVVALRENNREEDAKKVLAKATKISQKLDN